MCACVCTSIDSVKWTRKGRPFERLLFKYWREACVQKFRESIEYRLGKVARFEIYRVNAASSLQGGILKWLFFLLSAGKVGRFSTYRMILAVMFFDDLSSRWGWNIENSRILHGRLLRVFKLSLKIIIFEFSFKCSRYEYITIDENTYILSIGCCKFSNFRL